jgi:hypothetical protein
MSQDWIREDFLCYVLLYAASADLVIGEEEEDYIKSQVGDEAYAAIKKEFDHDNDAQRIHKIMNFSEGEDFDKEYCDIVLNDIDDLFLSDGNYSHWEKNIARALKRLMNS